MNKGYKIQTKPFVVPTDDGKLIEEHFGFASINSGLSIARMIAPPHWSEPFQTPEFEEYTLVLKGKKRITIGDKSIVIGPGESIKVDKGTRVQYANPFDEPCEYWAICSPPFSLEKVNREF
jgi:mannose-6-phosphate isomerase-like protein (cupin superfamily)